MTCPGCGRSVWATRLHELLDSTAGVSHVYRVLVGRRGHRAVAGGGACADWELTYSRVADAPDHVQPMLRALGRRMLRNLLDLGWVEQTDVRRAAGLDVAVEAEVAKRAAEDARLRYAYPLPPAPPALPPRIPITRLEPRTVDLSRFDKKVKP